MGFHAGFMIDAHMGKKMRQTYSVPSGRRQHDGSGVRRRLESRGGDVVGEAVVSGNGKMEGVAETEAFTAPGKATNFLLTTLIGANPAV